MFTVKATINKTTATYFVYTDRSERKDAKAAAEAIAPTGFSGPEINWFNASEDDISDYPDTVAALTAAGVPTDQVAGWYEVIEE